MPNERVEEEKIEVRFICVTCARHKSEDLLLSDLKVFNQTCHNCSWHGYPVDFVAVAGSGGSTSGGAGSGDTTVELKEENQTGPGADEGKKEEVVWRCVARTSHGEVFRCVLEYGHNTDHNFSHGAVPGDDDRIDRPDPTIMELTEEMVQYWSDKFFLAESQRRLLRTVHAGDLLHEKAAFIRRIEQLEEELEDANLKISDGVLPAVRYLEELLVKMVKGH